MDTAPIRKMYERSHKLHKYRTMHLFAGGGGGIWSDLLLGHRPICAVENNLYCQQVLSARQEDGSFPWFPIFSDVQEFDGKPWGGLVDIVEGGFPCTDISLAGKGAGIDGEKSGLWREMARIIAEVQPRFVFVENVRALVSRGLDRVLGDLADLGFDAEWDCFRASDVGAPHKRERLFILAYRAELGLEEWRGQRGNDEPQHPTAQRDGVALANSSNGQLQEPGRRQEGRNGTGSAITPLANAHETGRERARQAQPSQRDDTPELIRAVAAMAHASSKRRPEHGSTSVPSEEGACGGRCDYQPQCCCSELADPNQQHGDAGGLGTGSLCGERRQAPDVSGRMADAPELQQGQGEQFSTGSDSLGSCGSPRTMSRLPWPPGPNDRSGWSTYIAQGGPEPAICRGADGLADRSKRLATLGNGWVPQVAALAWNTLLNRMNGETTP